MGLDCFGASINRAAAWNYELDRDSTGRLALQEEPKSFPVGAVWDYHCMQRGLPADPDLIPSMLGYEKTELSRRS